MNSPDEYHATLRIAGDKVRIEEVTRYLGLEPTTALRKGQVGQSRAKAAPAKTDVWLYSTIKTNTPDQALMDILDRTMPASALLREKYAGCVMVYLGCDSDEAAFEFTICPEVFERLDYAKALLRVSVISLGPGLE